MSNTLLKYINNKGIGAGIDAEVELVSTPDPITQPLGTKSIVGGELLINTGRILNLTRLSKRSIDKLSIYEYMSSAQITDSQSNIGSFDLSASINAALIDAVAQNKCLYFPRGKYKVQSIDPIMSRSISIVGGFDARASEGGSEISYTGSSAVFQLGADDGLLWDTNSYSGVQGFNISNIHLRHAAPDTSLLNGKGSYKAGSCGIKDFRSGDITLSNVSFENFEFGFWGVQSDINTFYRPRSFYCKTGFYIGPRSDQNVIEDYYGFFNDCAFDVDRACDTWINRPVLVANGSNTTCSVTIRKGTTRTIIDSPWLENLGQGYQGMNNSFFDIGNINGYNNITSPVVGCKISNPFVYVSTQATNISTRYLIELGSAFVEIDEPVSPSGQSVNLSKFIHIPSGSAYTNSQAGVQYKGKAATESSILLNEGTGSSDIMFNIWGWGGQSIASTNGRFSIKKVNASVGSEELRISQEGVAGQVILSAPTYSSGQTTRFLLRKSYQQISSMPTSGTFETGDYVHNTNPTILTWSGGFAALAGAKYVLKGWIRMTTGTNHVLGTDWVEDRSLIGS